VGDSKSFQSDTTAFEPLRSGTPRPETTQDTVPDREPFQPRWLWSSDLPHLCKHLQLYNPRRHVLYDDMNIESLKSEASAGRCFAFVADPSVPDVIVAISGQHHPDHEDLAAEVFVFDDGVWFTQIDSGPRKGDVLESRPLDSDPTLGPGAQREYHRAQVAEAINLSDPRASIQEKCGRWISFSSRGKFASWQEDRTQDTDRSSARLPRRAACAALEMHESKKTYEGMRELVLKGDQSELLTWLRATRDPASFLWDARRMWHGLETAHAKLKSDCKKPFDPSYYCGTCADLK